MINRICKNDIALFDKLQKVSSGATGSIEEAQKIKVALQAFLTEPARAVKKKIQATGVSTDFEQLTTNAYTVTVQEDNFDLGYERAFREVSLEPGRDFWEIYDVQNGLTFRKVEEGGRIQIDKISGTKQTAYVDYYGGAIGWTDQMIRFRKIPAMVQLAGIFRNKFWSNKADVHYALLAAGAVGNQTTWQGVAADGQLQRDINTLNTAAFTVANRCKDKGYGDTANMTMTIYANPTDKARLNAAFRSTTANTAPAGATGQMVDWGLELVYTFNSSITAGAPLIILKGNKIQKATAMEPTTFSQGPDALTLQSLQAVWSIYGAAVADSDQCQSFVLGA